jgi:hypothetical protein
LPTHKPVAARRSRFSLPKIARVEILFAGKEDPCEETVWLESWNVPLSERISHRGEWQEILKKLG